MVKFSYDPVLARGWYNWPLSSDGIIVPGGVGDNSANNVSISQNF